MVQRDGRLIDGSDVTSARLNQLAGFQAKLLKHALSFPRVKRVVYSTCSVFAEENERVVHEVLQQVGDRFYLKNILSQLPRRGLDTYTLHGRKKAIVFEEASKCIRLQPTADLTNGFFVACFQRRKTPVNVAVDDDDVDNSNSTVKKKWRHMDENVEDGEMIENTLAAASWNHDNVSLKNTHKWNATNDSARNATMFTNIQKKKRKRENKDEGSSQGSRAPVPKLVTKTGHSKKKQKRW